METNWLTQDEIGYLAFARNEGLVHVSEFAPAHTLYLLADHGLLVEVGGAFEITQAGRKAIR